jgi:hypothetical protein
LAPGISSIVKRSPEKMTITVEITTEVQAELTRQAAAQGRELETYVATLLERAAQPKHQRPPAERAWRSRLPSHHSEVSTSISRGTRILAVTSNYEGFPLDTNIPSELT